MDCKEVVVPAKSSCLVMVQLVRWMATRFQIAKLEPCQYLQFIIDLMINLTNPIIKIFFISQNETGPQILLMTWKDMTQIFLFNGTNKRNINSGRFPNDAAFN